MLHYGLLVPVLDYGICRVDDSTATNISCPLWVIHWRQLTPYQRAARSQISIPVCDASECVSYQAMKRDCFGRCRKGGLGYSHDMLLEARSICYLLTRSRCRDYSEIFGRTDVNRTSGGKENALSC
jgi:hypothetical protein